MRLRPFSGADFADGIGGLAMSLVFGLVLVRRGLALVHDVDGGHWERRPTGALAVRHPETQASWLTGR